MKRLMASLLPVFLTASSLPHNNTGPQGAMFHNTAESGIHLNAGPGKPLGTLKWKFKTRDKIFSSPAIFNGLAYIGSGDGNLYAVNSITGRLIWKYKTGGAVHSSPAVYHGVVYFGSFDGYYYALDALSGKQKWKFKTGGEKWMGGQSYWGMKPAQTYLNDLWDYFLSSPVVEEEENGPVVYFGSSDGNLYAVDADAGILKWKFATAGSIHTTPVVDKGVIYFGNWDTFFYAVDTRTGTEKWKFKTGGQIAMSGIEASAIVGNGLVYFGARDGFFYALNKEHGTVTWKYDAANAWILSTAVIANGMLYVGTSDSYLLLALDAATGLEKWRFKTNGYVFSSPVLADHTIYFGDFTGKLVALDLAAGGKKINEFSTEGRKRYAPAVLKNDTLNFMYTAGNADLSFYDANRKVMDEFYKLGPIVSSPAIDNGVIYFGSADGYFYAVNIGG